MVRFIKARSPFKHSTHTLQPRPVSSSLPSPSHDDATTEAPSLSSTSSSAAAAIGVVLRRTKGGVTIGREFEVLSTDDADDADKKETAASMPTTVAPWPTDADAATQYKFGDLTRGVIAKERAARRGEADAPYKFGDLTRGLLAKSSSDERSEPAPEGASAEDASVAPPPPVASAPASPEGTPESDAPAADAAPQQEAPQEEVPQEEAPPLGACVKAAAVFDATSRFIKQ